MDKKIERYLTLRSEFQAELNELEQQIGKMQSELDQLNNRKIELETILYDPASVELTAVVDTVVEAEAAVDKDAVPAETKPWDKDTGMLVRFLTRKPGSSRSEIIAKFSNRLDENEVTNLLRRNQRSGLIENRGTRRNPEWWYVV